MTKTAQTLYQKAYKAIWEGDDTSLPPWKKRILSAIRIIFAVFRDIAEGQISLRAMSLVYTTVISLVPLLALSFSVLKGFGAHNEIRPMLLNTLEPLGDKKIEITENIIHFVDNIQVGVLGAVGLALLIYSVIAMMQKIERSFNYTWHIRRSRSFTQRFSDYSSVLLLAPLMIFLSVGLTTSIRSSAVADYLAQMPGMGHVLEIVGLIIPYFIMAIGFACIYIFMPNTKVRFRSAFIAGIVTAIIWKTMGWVFTLFVANSASHTMIYSAFASIIIFMTWMYLGWLVLLVGASIAFYHQNPQNMLIRQDNIELSNRVKEKLALAISYLIAQHYQQEKEPWTIEALAHNLNMPINAIEKVMQLLSDAGIFARTDNKPAIYLPAKPLNHIGLYDIIRTIRCADEHRVLNMSHIKTVTNVDEFFDAAREAVEKKLGKKTLEDIVRK